MENRGKQNRQNNTKGNSVYYFEHLVLGIGFSSLWLWSKTWEMTKTRLERPCLTKKTGFQKWWTWGNSLVVQWLGLWAFNAMDLGSILGWGAKTPNFVTQPKNWKGKTTKDPKWWTWTLICCWWGCKTVQSPWETAWQCLKESHRVRTCVCVCVHARTRALSHVRPLAAPWTVVPQASLSMQFSRQEYWSELPFPPSGDLPVS